MKMGRRAHLLRQLPRDRRGAAAVEMALVVPLMLGLIGGTFDFARGFSAKLDLVAAASRTAELATAPGQVRTDYSYLEGEAVAAAGREDAVSDVDWWLECNGVRRDDLTVCPSGNAYARYVSVEIDATYTPTVGLGGYLVGPVPIEGRAVVRIQ